LKEWDDTLESAEGVAHPKEAPIGGRDNLRGVTLLREDIADGLIPAVTCELVRYLFLLFWREKNQPPSVYMGR
jgi:hypothetical protein